MRKFKILPSLIVIGVIISLFSCEKVYLTEPPPVVLDTTIVYSFADTIQPIFNKQCVGCHGGGIPPDLSEGNSYDALINGGYVESDPANADQSEIYTKLLEGSHDGRATNEEEALILIWIKQGANNN